MRQREACQRLNSSSSVAGDCICALLFEFGDLGRAQPECSGCERQEEQEKASSTRCCEGKARSLGREVRMDQDVLQTRDLELDDNDFKADEGRRT